MSCATSSPRLTLPSERIGLLPGQGGCVCGCGGDGVEEIAGFMPGLLRGLGVALPEVEVAGWGRDPARSARIATESGSGTHEEREAEEDAFRTNAVLSSGRVDLLSEWVAVRESGDEEAMDAWWFEHEGELGLILYEDWLPEPFRCADAMKGDWLSCYVPDPYTQPWRTTADLDAMDIEAHADSVEIDGASDAERELLLAAWEVLQQNLDLVEWSLCIVLGDDSNKARRLLRKMTRGVATVRIHVVPDCDPLFDDPGGFRAWGGVSGGTIWICDAEKTQLTKNYLRLWMDGVTANDRWCSVLDLAVTLMHELSHTVGIAKDDDPYRPKECPKSYLIENAFRFILFRRYVGVTNSDCCSKYRPPTSDVYFGSAAADYVAAGDCLT